MITASFSLRKRYKNKPLVIYITRKADQLKNTLNSKGVEPLDKDGEVRLRGGKLDYGVEYTADAIKYFNGRKEIQGTDKRNRKWGITICEIGTSPLEFQKKGGRTEKPVMGKCKTKTSWLKRKLSASVLSQVAWSSIQDNLKKRRA